VSIDTSPDGRVEKATDAAESFAESAPEITRTRTLTWQDPLPSAAAGQ